MQRILITGSAGFIGFHLARQLLAAGHRVHGYDGLTPYYDVALKEKRHAMLKAMPGFTATEMTATAITRIQARTGRDAADIAAELARFNPQQRMVQPDEVAAAALFLCLPESQSVNGQAIGVNGGETS